MLQINRQSFMLILLITGAFILGACSSSASITPTPDANSDLPKDTLFQVIKPDGSIIPFTAADLKKLPLAQLTVEGKVEEGPSLKEVLKAAGVEDYQSIHLEGSSSPADLTRDQVNDNSILDFNNHGTVKLASPAIPKANWTKDVSRIEVK